LRFSLGDPDRLFGRAITPLAWMWSPRFVGASLLLFAIYAAITAARFEDVTRGTVDLYLFRSGASAVVLFLALFLVLGVIHELAHGLTTKRFGGRVHEIGLMLLYFSPALFCNTNDAWTFQRRSHRLWVTFAGPWIDLLIAALASIVWIGTEPGTAIHLVAFLTSLAAGIASLLTNLNPLLPLDGYYALSDWLEIPNLRRRSFEYWGWIGRRYVLGMDTPPPRLTPRERRVFRLYGGLALAYSVAIAVLGGFWVVILLSKLIGPWAWLGVAVGFGGLVMRSRGRMTSIAAAAFTSWRGNRRVRRISVAAAGVALLAGLTFVLPWTFRAKGHFTVTAVPRMQIHAEVGGILDRLHVVSGDTVRTGDTLFTLWNPRLESLSAEQRALVERLRLERSRSTAAGDLSSAATAEAALSEALEAQRVLERRRERLTLRAPIDGVVLGYRLRERLKARVQPGDLLVEVAALDGREARVQVPTTQAGGLAPGQTAHVKLTAVPRLKFEGAVSTVASAAEDGWIELVIPLPAAGWQPLPGMTGRAKVVMWRGTIAEAIGRKLRQTVRMDVWL
jgi:putative peptide zinc metalloprotease protein